MSFSFVFLLFPVSVIAGELIETKCGARTWWDDMVIEPTTIVGSIVLEDFDKTGKIGVEALVVGNGNQVRFNGSFKYKKIGNRLELNLDYAIPTNVTKEQFQEHFGLFPTVTCTAG